jgi:adenylosuccinate lyase
MVARVTDSTLYAHLWGTDELRAVFDERARLQSWLDILAALAAAQAELDLVPARAATAIAAAADADHLDLAAIAAHTRESGHSTLGLIRVWQEQLPEDAREYVYYGATVQDLTDTWMALAMRSVGTVCWRDLRAAEAAALDLAAQHRDTDMVGRTHGQPGAPITFGFKAASWADELRRHVDRLAEGAPRWLVGQLAGAVGTLAFFGKSGVALRERFCARLGLADPGISWLSSRDRVAEFVTLLAMITGTLGRIGNEVAQLQRAEIAELREPMAAGAVSSITMPHKRNPELGEHLVTLSRVVRSQANMVIEGMVAEHERDGRGWKAEWVAFPEACLCTGAALAGAHRLLAGLEVDPAAMTANIVRQQGYVGSERILAAVAARVGKHRAQELLQDALRAGTERRVPIATALAEAGVNLDLPANELAMLAAAPPDPGCAAAMVDSVLARARQARAGERPEWP